MKIPIKIHSAAHRCDTCDARAALDKRDIADEPIDFNFTRRKRLINIKKTHPRERFSSPSVPKPKSE